MPLNTDSSHYATSVYPTNKIDLESEENMWIQYTLINKVKMCDILATTSNLI